MNVEKMFTTIDADVAGGAFRCIVHSTLQLWNKDKPENETKVYEQARNLVLNEPRGHRGINGCIVEPSNKADVKVLFINQEDKTGFSYSGLIAAITVLLETGNLPV